MLATRIQDQNLVCVHSLNVTTRITAEYIVRPGSQKSEFMPVEFTERLDIMYQVKKKMIRD